MIYDFPDESHPIRQGDIFVGLPRVEVSLTRIAIVEGTESYETSWPEIARHGKQVNAVLPIRPVTAIVITQDCDAIRAVDISLCEIRSFRDVEGKAKNTSSPKSWVSLITQQARINLKWFYLPPDHTLAFVEKMAVDFRLTIRVPGPELNSLKSLRKGRLNPEADEHFRERLSEFFRRYPYDEWYPLSSDEFHEYKSTYSDTPPRPWQS